ncbi:hypothetical protein AwDysgo_18720 [Bacteroidales bacterium]|nr:hypothetical protein AwDysgo_18720 [Bacteroidales bacterium]
MKNNFLYAICFFVSFGSTLKAESEAEEVNMKMKFDYFFLEAIKFKLMENHSDAFNTFAYALSIDSSSSAALYEISNYYRYLDRNDLAIEALRKAVKNDGDQYEYSIALGNLCSELGQNTDAIDLFENMVRKYPEKSDLNFFLSNLYMREGDIEKAISALDTLEQTMGMNESLSLRKFQLYNMIDKKIEAFAEIEKLAHKNPNQARYPIMIGDFYLEQAEPEKALIYFEQAYKIDPENPYYVVSMANYYEQKQDHEAASREISLALTNSRLDIDTKLNILARYIQNLQENKKNIESANVLFDKLLEQHPQEKELNQMYGSVLLMQNKLPEAKFHFQLVTESLPENITAWKQLLSIALRENIAEQCISVCQRALVYFPEDSDFYFYQGLAYMMEEDFAEALKKLQEGIKIINPQNTLVLSEFYGQIGDLQHQLEQKELAYEAYEKAIQYNDKNIGALNNYAYFLSLDKQDLSKAERMSSVCVKLEPNNSTYIDTYAWIFFIQENYSLAKFYIESAISKGGDSSSEIVDHYGDILYKLGDKEKAVLQWTKALELGKEGEVIKKKIQEETYYEN